MTEEGIIINVYLGINAVDVFIRGDSPWVDLDLSRVSLDEHVVKL